MFKNKAIIAIITFLIVIIAGLTYLLVSKKKLENFEKEAPQIVLGDSTQEQKEDIQNSRNEIADILKTDYPQEDFFSKAVPNLDNNPEAYKKLHFGDYGIGAKIKGLGQITYVEYSKEQDLTFALVATMSQPHIGYIENWVFLTIKGRARILQDEYIGFMGVTVSKEPITYESVLKGNVTVPALFVMHYLSDQFHYKPYEFIQQPEDRLSNVNNKSAKVIEEHPKSKRNDETPVQEPKPQQVEDSEQVSWQRPPRVNVSASELENEARQMKVKVEANEMGTVVDVSIIESSGIQVLDEKVIRAVRSAKFKPFFKDGERQSISVEIPFEFSP